MKAIFVAGTDTGVGKTVITRLVARYLKDKGYNVATQKWVETGVAKSAAVFSFKLAASPHLAAKAEGRKVRIAAIKKTLEKLSGEYDLVVVEGTGGLMVPITETKLLVDVVKELKLPVLLVSANRLGAINHTLLSLEALEARKIKTLGVVFNNIVKDGNRLILKDNPKIVKKFAKGIAIKTLPWIDGLKKT